jgi:hypothetical protein
MKTPIKISFLCTLAMGLLLTECKKDEETDFVNDYSPTLTEASGTEYTGDYFPLGTYYTWNYEGTETTKGTSTTTENGESETETINESDDVSPEIWVGASRSVDLSDGAKILYPYYNDKYFPRYLEKTSSGVYVRAIMGENEQIIEIDNPAFIKSPLVVGDKWEVDPQMDISELNEFESMSAGGGDINAKSMFIVVGKEVKTWKGASYNTIRLDQRSEVSFSLNLNRDGMRISVSMNVQVTTKYNLIEDIGIAFEVMDVHFTESASMSFMGESYSGSADITMDGNYTLDSYDFQNNYANRETNGLKSIMSSSKTFSNNEVLNKIMNKSFEASKVMINNISLK